MTQSFKRRSFLKAAGASAAASTLALPTASARAQGANERIRIGFIGPGGRGFGAHVQTLARLKNENRNIELGGVAEVYSIQRDMVADYIHQENGNHPGKYEDYREMFDQEDLDAVSIATPDHWHCKNIVDSLNAGLNVYCEKPMTKQVEEAMEVVRAWKDTGKVMQVGVQGTSQPVWSHARELLQAGKIGKVLMYQTEYNRNSTIGQWRYYGLTKEMTPDTINWDLWLGKEEGLAPDIPFDREVYAQWRRFWPFGSGMYTDLFVHRCTMMLKATGLSYPGRVVGAGGLYLEYDGRDVPDVATVAADYPEGVHGLISSTMCNEESRLQTCIRGHFGSFIFEGDNIRFRPERPQVTGDSSLAEEVIEAEKCPDHDHAHFSNWIDAIEAGDPQMCNNTPELGAAAVTTVILGARSYREGRVFHFNPETGPSDGNDSWAAQWEQRSKDRGPVAQIAGWAAGDYGSTIEDPPHMGLAGPWVNGEPPAGG